MGVRMHPYLYCTHTFTAMCVSVCAYYQQALVMSANCLPKGRLLALWFF